MEVAVVIPVYNGERWIAESVESILSQEGAALEVVVVDDGSRDASVEILRGIPDERLRIVQMGANVGLIGALNAGIRETTAPFIARHDQDDIALPGRISAPLRLLKSSPEMALVGTCATLVHDDGHVRRKKLSYPRSDVDIRFQMLFGNPFLHSATTFRREALALAGGYRVQPWGNFPEDYDLWTRLARVGTMANLEEPLVMYRQHDRGLSATRQEEIRLGTLQVAERYFRQVGARHSSRSQYLNLVNALQFGGGRDTLVGLGAEKLIFELAGLSKASSPTEQDVSSMQLGRILARVSLARFRRLL